MIRTRRLLSPFLLLTIGPVLALAACGIFAASSAPAAEPEYLQTIDWPRQYAGTGDTVIVFDPQVDSWKEYVRLDARSAVGVKSKGSAEPVYGVIEYSVDTEIDGERKEVLFKNRKLKAVRFKGLDSAKAAQMEQIVRRFVREDVNLVLPLAYVLAQVDADAKKARSVTVNWDPPPIFSSESPAIMVMTLGKPEFKPLEGTDIQFCVNTNWDLFLHPGTSQYYLLHGEGWLTTKSPKDGVWTATTSLPAALSKLPANENWAEVRKHVPGKQIAVPKVFYTDQPAELIMLEGPAKYADLAGTELRYVTNTTSDLFAHRKDGNFYFVTSGRWFRAKSLSGPWTAATKDLPPDFTKIPPASPKGSVLASVPGTPEANDAVLLAEVPHKATVDPKAVSVNPTYDGDPTFVLIEGTSVYYAVNSPYSVFRVSGKYYCCQDGIWFCATRTSGPWAVCTSVPQEIYTIPPTSPKHNVTYVYVYDSTPDVVVVGYTAGYTGVYVSSGVVVYGTAYPVYYSPYYYYHYYPYHYGYGCAMHYNYAYGTYYRGASVYGPYGGAGYATAYNPHTGTYARGSYAYGPYGSHYQAQAYNPYTGGRAAKAGGSSPYASWGGTAVSQGGNWAAGGHYTTSEGTVAGVKTSEGGAAKGYKTDDGGAAVARSSSGDVYAAKDGTVYKKGEDGSWSQNSGNGWSSTNQPSQQNAQSAQSAKSSGTTSASQSQTSGEKQTTASQKQGSGTTSTQSTQNRSSGASSQQAEMEKQSQNRSRGWENSSRSSGGSGSRSGGGGGRRR